MPIPSAADGDARSRPPALLVTLESRHRVDLCFATNRQTNSPLDRTGIHSSATAE